MDGGRCALHGSVLFGNAERIEFEMPQCLLRVARFQGVDRTKFLDNRQFHGNAFTLLASAERFLRETLPIQRLLHGHVLAEPRRAGKSGCTFRRARHRGSSTSARNGGRNDQATNPGISWSQARGPLSQGVSIARSSGRADRDDHPGQTTQQEPALSPDAGGARIPEANPGIAISGRNRDRTRPSSSLRLGGVSKVA